VRLGILQPYLFPYLGYYQLVNCVDHLVFLDDVRYIKNGWINRNQIQAKQGRLWVTIRVKKDTLGLIKEAETVDLAYDIKKIRKSIVQSYSKALNFEQGISFLDGFFGKIESYNSISKIAQESIKSIIEYLDINKTFSCSSSLHIDSVADARVIDICKSFHANEYVNPIGGKELYDKSAFGKEGIALQFLRKNSICPKHSPDYWSDNASILDLIFHCDKDDLVSLLDEYSYE